MRATSIGHAGILIECAAGTILCDPWFEPAFLGSWFVFPRNDQLPDELVKKLHSADFLYLSHLHGDHQDEAWLRNNLRREIPILLPDFPSTEQRQRLERLGFTEFIGTQNGVPLELANGLTVAIHVETSITDGPGGDSALVVSDGVHRLVNQNDCRTTDTGTLSQHGPIDLHWLQFSGAIWYPMVYELDAEERLRLCREKVESQSSRAMRYVEAVNARAVVPSAGPPAFLDDDLFDLNMVTGDEASIFPDQQWFVHRLHNNGRTGILAIPGTVIELNGDEISVSHPISSAEVDAIFTDKAAYLERYRNDWKPWLEELHRSWSVEHSDIVSRLAAWWEPLMALAPTVCEAIGAPIVIRTQGDDSTTLDIIIDVAAGKIRASTPEHSQTESCGFRFDIERELLEQVVNERAVDWSNSLLLSCRFRAWRAGPYNENVYNFLKSLNQDRMSRTEAEAKSKSASRNTRDDADDVVVGDFVVQRRCPHRNADLATFGEIDGDDFVCTLHGWRFNLATGQCRTSDNHPIRIRRRGT